MHIKCANVRPKQFTQLISGNMILWKCPGCVVFLELPFCNLDREEIAGESKMMEISYLNLVKNLLAEFMEIRKPQ